MIKFDKIVFGKQKDLADAFQDYFQQVNFGKSIHDPLFPRKINIKINPDYLSNITFCNLKIFQMYGLVKGDDCFALYLLIPSALSVMDSVKRELGNPEIVGNLTTDTKEINSTLSVWTIGTREVYMQEVNFGLTQKKSKFYLFTITTIKGELY